MNDMRNWVVVLILVVATAYAGWQWRSRLPGQDVGHSPAGAANNQEGNPVNKSAYDLVTLLPPDAIPAIDHPIFVTGDEADQQYGPEELVLGVAINGDARAYSIPFLSGHEIVNDTVGGEPIAVTW